MVPQMCTRFLSRGTLCRFRKSACLCMSASPKFSNNSGELGSYSVVKLGRVNTTRSTQVPQHIQRPPYVQESWLDKLRKNISKPSKIIMKTATDINGIRSSCELAKTVLDYAAELVAPGITTEEIDRLVHEFIVQNEAYPSPLGYMDFPKSVCTSVNNVCCHGIPDDRVLLEGDIINIDVTVFYGGYHGDTSRTVLVGEVDQKGRDLVDMSRRCRDDAIAICGPGVRFCQIGKTISSIAESRGYDIVAGFCGHGIGKIFHELPDIFHFDNNEPGIMQPGMTFTIEPVITEGRSEIRILEDGWTAVTLDNSRSGQFEHTILITDNGCDILT